MKDQDKKPRVKSAKAVFSTDSKEPLRRVYVKIHIEEFNSNLADL